MSVQTHAENIQQSKVGLHNLVFKLDNPSAMLWLWWHWGEHGGAANKFKWWNTLAPGLSTWNFIMQSSYLYENIMCIYKMCTHPLLDPSNPTAAYCQIKYAVVQVILHPEEEG